MIKVWNDYPTDTTVISWEPPKMAQHVQADVIKQMTIDTKKAMFEQIAVQMAKSTIDDLVTSLAKVAVGSGWLPPWTTNAATSPKSFLADDSALSSALPTIETEFALVALMEQAIGKHLFPETAATQKLLYQLQAELYKSPDIEFPHLTMDMIHTAIKKMAHPSSGTVPGSSIFLSPSQEEQVPTINIATGVGGSVIDQLEKAIPGLKKMNAACPACAAYAGPLVVTVIHLNDFHEWTREAIADWLETLDHDLTMHPVEGGDKDGSSND